jgi:hypothetical protein
MAAAMTHIRRSLINAGLMVAAMALLASVAPAQNALTPNGALEDIYILHSVREPHEPEANWCAAAKTGFDPFPKDAERLFSFWSLRTRPEDGKVVDAKAARAAKLRACFGPTSERARQNFYAEVQMGSVSFQGKGECLAVMTDFPETGLFPVRCQLVLSGMQPPYIGGLLTTNTMTSKAPLGSETNPSGYTQASIATIRLWKKKQSE